MYTSHYRLESLECYVYLLQTLQVRVIPGSFLRDDRGDDSITPTVNIRGLICAETAVIPQAARSGRRSKLKFLCRLQIQL